MTMNNINIVEKKDNENDKHISKFFLRNKIYLDNIKVENSLYYEEFLSTFLKENNYNSYQLEFFNQRVNAKLLFETVYEFFKQLDDELFKKVLCHEITHAAMYAYNISIPINQEELFADIMATYGEEIINMTNTIYTQIRESY